MTRTVVNLVAFQAGWMACVLGAANGRPWAGALAVVAAVVLHLSLAANRAAEIRLIVFAATLGLVFDSALLSTGWVSYPSGMLSAYVAPYWILAMWALFATTLNGCLRWIKRSVWLAAVLGAIGGPLSYLAGARLGGIELIDPVPALVALALIWAFAMSALVLAARRYGGVEVAPNALQPGVVTQE